MVRKVYSHAVQNLLVRPVYSWDMLTMKAEDMMCLESLSASGFMESNTSKGGRLCR